MKAQRESAYRYEEASAMVQDYVNNYEGKCYVREGVADCSAFPCMIKELETWSGETWAIYVYDEESGEEVYAVAYWE